MNSIQRLGIYMLTAGIIGTFVAVFSNHIDMILPDIMIAELIFIISALIQWEET